MWKITRRYEEYPIETFECIRSIAEDDLVALHSHQVWPEINRDVTIDFFRSSNPGIIVKHRNTIQHTGKIETNNKQMYKLQQ